MSSVKAKVPRPRIPSTIVDDERLQVVRDYLDHECRLRVAWYRGDGATVEREQAAVEGYYVRTEVPLGGTLTPLQIGFDSKSPIRQNLTAAQCDEIAADLVPRTIYRIDTYEHRNWPELYRVVASAQFATRRGGYSVALFWADVGGRFGLVAIESICSKGCRGRGVVDGAPCLRCDGRGWFGAGGPELPTLGSLRGVLRVEPPTDSESLALYQCDTEPARASVDDSAFESRVAQSEAARLAYWCGLGDVGRCVLAPAFDLSSIEGGGWPAGRPSFRVVRTLRPSTIIASDGLSDPFRGIPIEGGKSGFELEVWGETADPIEGPIEHHWLASLVAEAASLVANHGQIRALLDERGFLSAELNGVPVPSRFLTASNTVYVLLRYLPEVRIGLPLTEARLVNVRLLSTDQGHAVKASEAALSNLARRLDKHGLPGSSSVIESR
jgi:hypothetical protein